MSWEGWSRHSTPGGLMWNRRVHNVPRERIEPHSLTTAHRIMCCKTREYHNQPTAKKANLRCSKYRWIIRYQPSGVEGSLEQSGMFYSDTWRRVGLDLAADLKKRSLLTRQNWQCWLSPRFIQRPLVAWAVDSKRELLVGLTFNLQSTPLKLSHLSL